MTPEQFYAENLNKVVDVDGYPKGQPYQCIDGFRWWGRCNSVPVPATPDDRASGYWTCKNQKGEIVPSVAEWQSRYFDKITDPKQFRNGDWIIWGWCNSHPQTHVAMWYNGQEFGENQGTFKGFTLKSTDFSDALGGLRWKGYGHMEIEKGYHHLSYKGIEVDIIRATAASGYKLHLLSAGDPYSVQDIMKFDSDRLAIVGAVNANYFEMSTGLHLGCEGDGWVNGYWQAPKKAGIISYYISDLGKIGAHDQADFWLSQSEVQMVCAPYSVLIHNGQNTELRSASFGSKELIKNTQTAILRIQDDWCLAIFSECFPSDVHAFAQEAGANELALMDSGGSTQMFECATTGHRRAVRHTGRLLPNVLVLAKEINPAGTPDQPDVPQPEPEPGPIEDEPVQTPDPAGPTEGDEDMSTLPPGMSNETFDMLRYLAEVGLPALATFVTGLGLALDKPVLATVGTVIMLTSTFLGSLVDTKRKQYNAQGAEK